MWWDAQLEQPFGAIMHGGSGSSISGQAWVSSTGRRGAQGRACLGRHSLLPSGAGSSPSQLLACWGLCIVPAYGDQVWGEVVARLRTAWQFVTAAG